MKKFIALMLVAAMLTVLASCSSNEVKDNEDTKTEETKNEETKNDEGAVKADSAEAVLSAIWANYDDEHKFSAGGGDSENMSMEGPAKFDITKTEEVTSMLALPESEIANVEEAASLVHMMNANTFTGAAYKLKDGVAVNDFAANIKSALNSRQWICGFPDCFTVIEADGYVVVAFGAREIVDYFKTTALSTFEGANAVLSEDIVA